MIEPDDPRVRLCAITDDLRDGVAGLVSRALSAERGGTTMILLRLKYATARELSEAACALVGALTIPVIVQERLDVALAAGAAGVQLGAASLPVTAVRRHVPAGFLVGASVASDGELLLTQGADFVAIGPVFGDGDGVLGLDRFAALRAAARCPVLAVGGVAPPHMTSLRAAGASGVAVLRGLMGAADPSVAALAYTEAWPA